MARTREPGWRVKLSPSLDAVISGPGRVILLAGRDHPQYVHEREMATLVSEWLAFEQERRGPEAVRRLLPPANPGGESTP